jgi:hypothetical protein
VDPIPQSFVGSATILFIAITCYPAGQFHARTGWKNEGRPPFVKRRDSGGSFGALR